MSDGHPSIGGLPLVLGGNVFGWTLDRDGSFEVLDAFYEAGGRMIDTAEGYSSFVPGNKGGESETIIGEWMELRDNRADMLIGTKTNMSGAAGGLAPGKLASALAGSLERLRSDYVDLFYAHSDDPETPLEDITAGFDALVKAGKARELGASNYKPGRLAATIEAANAAGRVPFTVLQNEYNLVERSDFEGSFRDICRKHGVAALPYYGLAAGFLTGKYRTKADLDGKARGRSVERYLEKGGAVLAAMDEVVAETGASHAQVAIAWICAQPGITAPIASVTSPAQLAELIAAVSLKLEPDQIERLSKAGQ
jgi:aryl-alcohol dehydrogenase-like predicted oxidoreductase